jgi:hypothetical protein
VSIEREHPRKGSIFLAPLNAPFLAYAADLTHRSECNGNPWRASHFRARVLAVHMMFGEKRWTSAS